MAVAIGLTPVSSNPLPSGQSGLWLSPTGNGELMVQKTDGTPAVNVSEAIAGGLPASAIQTTLINGSGSAFTGFQPVSVNSSGDATTVNVSDLTSAHMTSGITTAGVSSLALATIVTAGKLTIVSGVSLGTPVFVSKTGGLTQDYPTIGIDGFVSGDFVIKVGVPTKNQSDATKIDLLVNIHLVGQL